MYDDGQDGVMWSMMRLMHRLQNLLHARLHEVGLFRGQPPVLHFLCSNGPMSQKELADLLGLSPATMTVTLKRMQKAGLIARETDPKDQRVQLVRATEYGERMNGTSRDILSDIRDCCLDGFSEDEKDQMLAFIARMGENIAAQGKQADCE